MVLQGGDKLLLQRSDIAVTTVRARLIPWPCNIRYQGYSLPQGRRNIGDAHCLFQQTIFMRFEPSSYCNTNCLSVC